MTTDPFRWGPVPALALLFLTTAPVLAAGDLPREQAEKACSARDLPGLFNAMTLSDAVLREFLAPEVTVSEGDSVTRVAPADYDSLPIRLLDFSYVTRASFGLWEADPEAGLDYVAVEFNQSQDDRWRVDWQQMSGPILEGASDVEQPRPVGASGYLLFYPTPSCWHMVQDHVDTP